MYEDLTMKKDTVEISGGRNLYNYHFQLDGEELPPMKREDLLPGPDEKKPE
jgi:hypothetical protein